MNLMLDLETLSTEPDAMVFDVAVVPFDDNGVVGDDHLGVLFFPQTGHIDPGTVVWWMRKESCLLTQTNCSETEAAEKIWEYLNRRQDFRLWAMPTSFDCIILEQFLKRNGHGNKLPIDFRKWRDVRTVRELAWWPEPEKREGHVTHNPYDDCVRQIDTLAECWRRLRTVTNQKDVG